MGAPLNILPTPAAPLVRARVLKLGSSRSGAVVRGVARGTVDSTVFNLQPKHRSRAIRAANRYVRLRNFQLTESFRVKYGQQRALKRSWPGGALSEAVDGPLIPLTIHVKIHGSACTIRPILAVSARFSPNARSL